MDCETYIDNFLSAHADGELGADDLKAAQEHVAGCANCRAALEEERALKDAISRHASMKAPGAMRDRISAALDMEAGVPVRAPTPRPSRFRARIWIPVAIAAALIIAFISVRMRSSGLPPVAPFDVAVAHFDKFRNHFTPNVPSTSRAQISDAYIDHQMPGYLWNFHKQGFDLIGGRIEKLSDGSTATFTMYMSVTGPILCARMHAPGMQRPPAPYATVGDHYFYEYRGNAVCLTMIPNSDVICVIVQHGPVSGLISIIDSSLS